MVSASFDEVWRHIVGNAGERFFTIRNLEFTYTIEGDYFRPSRTDYRIPKSDSHKAFKLVSIKGPGVIIELVRGPAYVWAVLRDERISSGK
ncbi:MAG: hypothetical protein QXU32_09000 [Nitrososphaerales archaeon]